MNISIRRLAPYEYVASLGRPGCSPGYGFSVLAALADLEMRNPEHISLDAGGIDEVEWAQSKEGKAKRGRLLKSAAQQSER